jgi:hypothetical protein
MKKTDPKTGFKLTLAKGVLIGITLMIGFSMPKTISLAKNLTLDNFLGSVKDVSASGSTEWTQEAHDAQRTGYTAEEPQEPWSLAWTWNGADANGGTGGHTYNAPPDARTVTGGANLYVPAGAAGLFALRKTDGSQAWQLSTTAFNATPAYDPATGYLYAGGADGKLYTIDGSTGSVLGTYTAGGALNKAMLLVGSSVYGLTDSGEMHKVNTGTMSRVWVYTAGANTSTPAAYSAKAGVLIYCTADLYVHAVRDSDGGAQWRVKPTSHTAADPYTFTGYWPVVAEQHGEVFVRLNLGADALWSGAGQGTSGGGVYPLTNADTRTLLQSNNGALENLFALDLKDGSPKFIPAVGYGGVEYRPNGSSSLFLQSGPAPVVKVNGDGSEVAYIPFRSGQGNPPDGRWDSHMGEMMLDNTTIPGLAAGDLRFVDFPNSYVKITDEQTPFTMAGSTLLHAHWGASESTKILDRSAGLGLNASAPITSQAHPAVIRRQQPCASFNPQTHQTTCGLTLFGDGRYWSGPGFWEYWNVMDPPTPSGSSYSAGLLPRYTYVSDGMIVVEGNGGDLSVFHYAGGSSPAPTATSVATSIPAKTSTPAPRPTVTQTWLPIASATNPSSATLAVTTVPTQQPPTAALTAPPSSPTQTAIPFIPTKAPVTPAPTSGQSSSTISKEYGISSSSDDANEDGTSFSSTDATLFVGNASSAQNSWMGLRFTGVDIPAGAQIQSATIRVKSSASQWISTQFDMSAEAASACQSFSVTNKLSTRTRGTAKSSISTNEQWNSGSWYTLAPLSAVIQEAVTRAGWQPGGSVCILIHGTGNPWGRKFAYSFDSSTANAPRLDVTYQSVSSGPPTATALPTSLPTNPVVKTSTPTAQQSPTAAPSPTSKPAATATPGKSPTIANTPPSTATYLPMASSTPTATYLPVVTTTSTAAPISSITPSPTPPPAPTGPPASGQISNLKVIANAANIDDKFEVQFNMKTSAANLDMPFDANPPAGLQAGMGVTVNALFSVDNWKTSLTQPAFLDQPYTHTVVNGKDHFTPAGGPVWDVRFTPQQAGTWQYRLSVQDSQGQSNYPDPAQNALSFTVGSAPSNPNTSKGFLGVSQTDRRYFQFQDGTPFVGVGYNDGFNDSASVEQKMTTYQQNRMNFMRVWMSGSGINGSQWSSWASNFIGQDGYLPGTSFDTANTYNGGAVSMRLDDANPCLYADFWQGGVPVEPNTKYQVTARVKVTGLTGPATAGDYGFVIKQGGWLDKTCSTRGTGTRITAPVAGSTDWITVNGTYTTGPSDSWLGNLYLARENASGGQVYIDEVHLYRADDPAKVDLLRQPYANAIEHFDPMNAAQWDLYIQSAEQHGVYLKLVIDEKNEWIRDHMGADGKMTAVGSNDNFYAAPGTKVRWLEQAWWRYIIARWGYSTAVHSFEFINEGDPYDGHLYEATEAMAKYFHQNDPSHHMVTTSFWSSFPNQEFWSNPLYPDVDYADLHAYISTGWGVDASFLPANMLETRPAYVYSGTASAKIDGAAQTRTSIVPRGLVIQGPGEWVIKYWMKAEGLTASCPYAGSGSMLRVRWLLDGGKNSGAMEGVVPVNSDGKDFVCASPAGTFNWTQFTSTSDRNGSLLPTTTRLVLTDNKPHQLSLYLENSYGTGGTAWIDDLQIVNPSGQVQPVIGQFITTPMDEDTAWYNQAYAQVFGGGSLVGAHKPLVRGETGIDYVGDQTFNPDLLKDKQGIWLHNNLWGQVNSGGMADLFWWATETIPQSIFNNFLTFRNFMEGIPLSNGHYQDSQAQTSNPQLKAVGQRDDVNGRMHLWVENTQHTWRNVVYGVAVTPVSGTITIPNVAAGSCHVEWWNTYATTNPVFLTQTVPSNGSLVLTLPAALSDDVAIKINKVP